MSVDKDTLALALKVTSAAALGFYAGSSLYINAVEVPAALDYENDAEHALMCWQRNFARASRFCPSLHGIGVLSALGHYGITKGTSKADVPFLFAALAGELSLPYTLICLMPTNRRLMAIEECKKNGPEYIRSQYETWNKGHAIRTLLAVGTFGYALYRLAIN